MMGLIQWPMDLFAGLWIQPRRTGRPWPAHPSQPAKGQPVQLWQINCPGHAITYCLPATTRAEAETKAHRLPIFAGRNAMLSVQPIHTGGII